MLKILVLLAIVLGAGITLLTFKHPMLNDNNVYSPYPGQTNICGINVVYTDAVLNNSNYKVSAGFPFNKQWVYNMNEGSNHSNDNDCQYYPNGFYKVFYIWQTYLDIITWTLIAVFTVMGLYKVIKYITKK